MGDRMTSAQARQAADKACSYSATAAMRLREAADALAAWEAEDAARRGIEKRLLDAINWLMGCAGEFTGPNDGVHRYWWRSEFGRRAPIRYDGIRYVVEVAEPEPVKPRQEQGPSGWWYERREMKDGVVWVKQYRNDGNVLGSSITDTTDPDIPPADRALVARLLGEVG